MNNSLAQHKQKAPHREGLFEFSKDQSDLEIGNSHFCHGLITIDDTVA